MEAKTFADGSISRMCKELTAVSIFVVPTANPACAMEEQVVEAIGVGIE